MDEPITKIIGNPVDIKLGQFTQEELDVVLRKIKNRKTEGLEIILGYFMKTCSFPILWKT